MPRTLQFKRYPAAVIANTTGANGELIINTTNYNLTVHDGTTAGGHAVTTTVQGPFANNSSANAGGVLVGEMYYKSDGIVYVRLS